MIANYSEYCLDNVYYTSYKSSIATAVTHYATKCNYLCFIPIETCFVCQGQLNINNHYSIVHAPCPLMVFIELVVHHLYFQLNSSEWRGHTSIKLVLYTGH